MENVLDAWHYIKQNDLPNNDEIHFGESTYTNKDIERKRDISDRILVYCDDGMFYTGYFMTSAHTNGYEFGEHYKGDPNKWICSMGLARTDSIIAWKYLDIPNE